MNASISQLYIGVLMCNISQATSFCHSKLSCHFGVFITTEGTFSHNT